MTESAINRILLAYDFSRQSENALDSAIAIAQQQNSSLTLLHVVNNTGGFHFTSSETITQPLQQLARIASEKLNILVKTLASRVECTVDFAVEVGIPAFVICQQAWEKDIDLIVIGKSVGNSLKQYLVDSIPAKVIKNASCPVLSIPSERLFTKFRKIVFPVRNAPLMLEKYDIIRPLFHKDSEMVVTGLTSTSNHDSYRKVTFLVEALEGKLEHDGVNFVSRVDFCDSISDRLLEITREESPDLLVITTVVNSHFRKLFLDYYSKVILNKVECPVLTVKPDAVATV